MARNLLNGSPYAGNPTQFCPVVSDYQNAYVLAANTAKSATIPDWANYVAYSGTTDFYANHAGTASVPSSDVTDGTASTLNPSQRLLLPGSNRTVSLISASSCTVTVSFWA